VGSRLIQTNPITSHLTAASCRFFPLLGGSKGCFSGAHPYGACKFGPAAGRLPLRAWLRLASVPNRDIRRAAPCPEASSCFGRNTTRCDRNGPWPYRYGNTFVMSFRSGNCGCGSLAPVSERNDRSTRAISLRPSAGLRFRCLPLVHSCCGRPRRGRERTPGVHPDH
jgi:hypothetical protein